MKKITLLKDTLLNVEYSLNSVNSKDLIKTLKNNLKLKSINYNDFNDDYLDGYDKKPTKISLPIDVYEYQNFFLLEKENGELILLDGFRRLLWNNPVDHEILVRVYKEKDIDEHSILKLLVSLNHTKFFGGIGNFYDRGFALGMYSIFGVNITKIYDSFNGYLTSKEFKYEYYNSKFDSEEKHVAVVDKVRDKSFISDMRFLETLANSDLLKMDTMFGAFVYSIRKRNPNIVLDANDFISKVKANSTLIKQIESFKKAKDARGYDIGNKMFEMFSNILLNKVGEKSFVERTEEIDNVIKELKKDKSWFNYTGNKKYFFSMTSNLRDKDDKFYQTKGVEGAIKSYYRKHKKYPEVKVFVYPSENSLLKEGIYDNFKIKGFESSSHLMSTWNIIKVVNDNGIELKRKWMKDNRYDLSRIDGTDFNDRKNNDIVLFIKDLDFNLENK